MWPWLGDIQRRQSPGRCRSVNIAPPTTNPARSQSNAVLIVMLVRRSIARSCWLPVLVGHVSRVTRPGDGEQEDPPLLGSDRVADVCVDAQHGFRRQLVLVALDPDREAPADRL